MIWMICGATMVLLAPQAQAGDGDAGGRWDVEEPHVRANFVEAVQRIDDSWYSETSSTAEEVLAILGEPDDIITPTDPVPFDMRLKEIWCYGTNGHLTLATLGAVSFDLNDRVMAVAGGYGAPPPVDLIPEAELRALLRAVGRIPRGLYLDAGGYNPAEMVSLINHLRLLGKERSLAVLAEYARICSSSYGLDDGRSAIIILRFLFESDELHPTTYLPFEEHKSEASPAFPAVVIDGIPFVLFPLGGWGLGGGLPDVDEYVEWYGEHGRVRANPLMPIDDPREAWHNWWNGLREAVRMRDARQAEAGDGLMQEQLLRLVETVHPRKFDEDSPFREDPAELWESALSTLDRTRTRWDAENNRYVRADNGSWIEPKPEPRYRRAVWTLPVKGRSATVALLRLTDHRVAVGVHQVADNAPLLPVMKVRVSPVEDPATEIASITFDGPFTNGSGSSNTYMQLEKGVAVRIALILNEQVVAQSEALSLDEEVGE